MNRTLPCGAGRSARRAGNSSSSVSRGIATGASQLAGVRAEGDFGLQRCVIELLSIRANHPENNPNSRPTGLAAQSCCVSNDNEATFTEFTGQGAQS